MSYRVLVRFVGVSSQLAELYDAIMEQFPEAELPSEDCGDWYSVDDVMMDEYECRFEELPEGELLAMDGSIMVEEDEFPEDFFGDLMERFEHVFGALKWSSFDVGVGCGTSDGWGEFISDWADDGSDEANEISEAVLGF
ncbi:MULTISPECIES: hypothetical protein [unclassified Fibrobacter]|uniref:hypothetical protein n=1 Tax=unclassified Fibrobacter TaxID=2634177 RepID=UPI000D6BD0DB|nr:MULTISPECIES: hypothetical protein [unclassified Fibrobacter]PWJ62101.1 hypothetical protein BGX12_12332 [Fibrobacter sp. UWR4]PZW67498.1 hypothetical protein C8E88_102335 [Fibrobacter sp. UWR1]